VVEALGHRLERFVLRRLTGGGEGGQRAAVEAPQRAHHDVPAAPAVLAGQLQRALHGLGAGIGEEHLAELPGDLGEEAVDLHRRSRGDRVGEQVAHVEQLLGLGADRLGDRGVRVTEADHGQATEEVEVALALAVPQLGALAANEHDLRRPEDRHERAARELHLVEGVAGHVSPPCSRPSSRCRRR
jgi:hypothetical protein